MHWTERIAIKLRHTPGLNRAAPLWNLVRPVYDWLVVQMAGDGLVRQINGTDPIHIHAAQRGTPDIYEPDVWPLVMGALRPGDTFVDVGAFIGLYAIAATRHVGRSGRVVAFEPDPVNRRLLAQNVSLNALGATVEIVGNAVGSRGGQVALAGHESEVQTSYVDDAAQETVPCVTLDAFIAEGCLNVLKIDVEGFEQAVLEGAEALLMDTARRPRAIFVEVHPFAWERTGTTSDSLLAVLARCGYKARTLDGQPVGHLETWEEIIASPLP